MKSIGIIDDRTDVLETTSNAIRSVLTDEFQDWSLIATQPFEKLDEYRSWIIENDLGVIVIDQKLNENKVKEKYFSPFLGNQIINNIWGNFKDLPIFGLTNYSVEAMNDVKAITYDIIERPKFTSNIETYVRMFVKSGENFYKLNRDKLERLSELAEIIALGNATDRDKTEAKGLQLDLQIPHFASDAISHEEYIRKLEKNLNEIKDFKSKIEDYIKKQNQ
ncbi:MAG: hypothetical protein WC644_04820 [Ignavibacteria bacterium]